MRIDRKSRTTGEAKDGDLDLPSYPLFTRLFEHAQLEPPRTVIRDNLLGTETTYRQLLLDTLALRKRLQIELGVSHVPRGHEVYIAVLAAGGHEFAVAVLAVLALGAAVVPLLVDRPADEAIYFLSKSRAVAVLASSAALRSALEVEMLVKSADSKSTFVCIPIAPSVYTSLPGTSRIRMSSHQGTDEKAPAVVLFTSGSTGPPKGAIMPRSWVSDSAVAVAHHYEISAHDILLHVLPVHNATGLGMMFFPFLAAGACIEFHSGSLDPGWVWDRFRQGGVSFFSGIPSTYSSMLRHYRQNIEGTLVAKDYRRQLGKMICLCGSSALPATVADSWAQVSNKHILLRYGGTEFGAVLSARPGDEEIPEGSVGEVSEGVDLKLSMKDEGEVLVKSPYMFTKYLYDEEATHAAFDDEGYYKTGDIARREGQYYWILGRLSVDIIRSGGHIISALDVEREIMALEYVRECMVVGVKDAVSGHRVAVALVLESESAIRRQTLSLCKLRADLKRKLARYKLPTIMRLLAGEVPKASNFKVNKELLGPLVFPLDYRTHRDVQYWDCGLVYNSPRASL